MDDLKPCPFCGYNMANEEDCAYQKAGFVGPRTPVWEVCCGSTECNASVSTTSRESAVTAWNTRAASGGDVAIKTDRSFTPNLEEPASLEQRARRLGQLVEPPYLIQPPGCRYTPQEVGRMLANRVVQPHYAEWLVHKAITAALANQQGVEKDAARYRALRGALLDDTSEAWEAFTRHPEPKNADDFDSAIDAAMATQPAGDVGRGEQ